MRPVARRRAAVLVAAAAVIGFCFGLGAASCAPASAALAPPAPFTVAPVPGEFQAFGLDSEHAAFPTVTKLSDGRLRMMWREGATHVSADGRIMTSVSDPNGTGWSPPAEVALGGTGDFRDPHLAAFGSDVFLTYFTSVGGVPSGARVARSTDGGATFAPSVRIDPAMPYAAISSPVVKVGAKLLTGFYGRKAGETIDTAWAAWSTDNGASWTSNRIANGIGAGKAYNEPWAVSTGSTVVYLMRDGTSSIASRSTPDGGATWSVLHGGVIANATGNSASVRASNARIYTVYRNATTRSAMLASSGDGGLTFTVERELMPRPAGSASASVGMTYGHPIEIGDGYIFCPLGMERTALDSRIYLGFL